MSLFERLLPLWGQLGSVGALADKQPASDVDCIQCYKYLDLGTMAACTTRRFPRPAFKSNWNDRYAIDAGRKFGVFVILCLQYALIRANAVMGT